MLNHPTSIGPLNSISPRQKGGAAGPSAPNSFPGTHPLALANTRQAPTGAAGTPENRFSPSKPWGNDTVCPKCNRGATYSCICDPFFDDDEQMPAADVCRLMAEYFPETGWAKAEKAALSPKRNGDGSWSVSA